MSLFLMSITKKKTSKSSLYVPHSLKIPTPTTITSPTPIPTPLKHKVLKGSMVERIQNIKPGCGACGK